MAGGTSSRAVAVLATTLSVAIASKKHIRLRGFAQNFSRRRGWTSRKKEHIRTRQENVATCNVPPDEAVVSDVTQELHNSSVQRTVQDETPQRPMAVAADSQNIDLGTQPPGVRVGPASEPAQEVPVNPAEQRKARRKKCIRFRGEDEDDYTKGPIRIVGAFDGIENVASLLLNLDLSQKIQAALSARRDLQTAERVAIDERSRWQQLGDRIGGEIGNMELMIRVVRDQSVMIFSDQYMAEVEASKQDVENLKGFLSAVHHQYLLVDMRLQSKIEALRSYREDVDRYLEEAFVVARLMPPAPAKASPVFEEFDFKSMYEHYCQHGFTLDEGELIFGHDGLVVNGPNAPADIVGQIGPDEQEKRDTEDAFDAARRKLERAQEAFDMRRGIDAHEQLNLCDEEPIQLEYSLRWVQRGRELTPALIKAEKEEHKARQAALDAGVVIADQYQSSNFGDHPDDGYRESYENNAIAQVPRKRIAEWLARIPDSADPEEQKLAMRPEIDDWSAGYVDIGDSRSLVGDSSQQKKIKGWAETCDRMGR
ncbi:hypothetical protein CKM354_000417900 [Cercospora kikuchii]|uniref:Uncharacterized protein n=1 Tax=Cercospora kikuchii TaxID=84275 RepID=A0A9P3CCS7_9PEZI|nr:uncharacterized protein CKM354_000417900 [Cercospora kikuchii]GIZ40857.1 hypothetical protein CKM354_000417900 [Cercospora kikuchii]